MYMQHGHEAERSSHGGVIQHAQGKPSDSHLDIVPSGSTRPLALQLQPPHVADDRAGDTIWPQWLWETGTFVRCLHGHKLCVDDPNATGQCQDSMLNCLQAPLQPCCAAIEQLFIIPIHGSPPTTSTSCLISYPGRLSWRNSDADIVKGQSSILQQRGNHARCCEAEPLLDAPGWLLAPEQVLNCIQLALSHPPLLLGLQLCEHVLAHRLHCTSCHHEGKACPN